MFVLRALSNPDARAEIPVDFPKSLTHADGGAKVIALLKRQLHFEDLSFHQVKRINVVYSHKHPEKFPRHSNNAEKYAAAFLEKMREAAPQIDWINAAGICETAYLNRAVNQGVIHTLTAKQAFEFYAPAQKDPFPFVDPQNKKPEFFIVLDWTSEQGTTLISLINYIKHNGGVVLAAMTDVNMSLAQDRQPAEVLLSPAFNDPARNTGRLPELAQAFAASAAKEGLQYSPQQCLEMFEERLNKLGNSLFALTNNECLRIRNNLVSASFRDKESFPGLIRKLDALIV